MTICSVYNQVVLIGVYVHLKLPFHSQLINFLKKYFKELAYNYILINTSNKGICVEFWRKNNTTLVYLLSNCRQVLYIV